MRISVIIATRNRAEQLSRCLDTFEQIHYSGSWEVVVADNGSSDGTAELLESRKRTAGYRLTSCVETTPGASAARNSGVNHSQGELLVFTDDDCHPQADFLERIDALFSEQPNVSFGGGRVLLYDSLDLPLTLQLSTEALHLPAGRFFHSGTIHGANMFFRREVFFALRGFDEGLGPGNYFSSGEDTDLLRRALFCGYNGFYDPGAVMYHHHGRKDPVDRKRLHQSYDRGTGGGFMKQLAYRPDKKRALKVFWWHLQTMPGRRRLRQTWYFMLYAAHTRLRPGKVNAHRSGLRSEQA